MNQLDLTQDEVERLGEAMKNEEFRKLLAEYVEEIADPENRRKYEEEIAQLERERGNQIRWVKPEPAFVVKTRVLSDSADSATQKMFINVAQSTEIEECRLNSKKNERGQRGWSIPYSLSGQKEDWDHAKQPCLVFDCVFHPNTIRMGYSNAQFMGMLISTAIEAVEAQSKLKLDKQYKLPKLKCKGALSQTVIRTQLSKEEQKPDGSLDYIEEKLREQKLTNPPPTSEQPKSGGFLDLKEKPKGKPKIEVLSEEQYQPANTTAGDAERLDEIETPVYEIVHRGAFDMQDYTNDRDSTNRRSNRPKELVVRVSMPLVDKLSEMELDVSQRDFSLMVPSKYRLSLQLPFPVDDKNGNARFDKKAHRLEVVLPVLGTD